MFENFPPNQLWGSLEIFYHLFGSHYGPLQPKTLPKRIDKRFSIQVGTGTLKRIGKNRT